MALGCLRPSWAYRAIQVSPVGQKGVLMDKAALRMEVQRQRERLTQLASGLTWDQLADEIRLLPDGLGSWPALVAQDGLPESLCVVYALDPPNYTSSCPADHFAALMLDPL